MMSSPRRCAVNGWRATDGSLDTYQEWEEISALASTARRQPWQSHYGCPDCADQGAWTLTVRVTSGETRSTVLDTHAATNPEPLQQVIEAVRALRADSR